MSRRKHPFEDTPQRVQVGLNIPCDFLLVEWLPVIFNQSKSWVQDHILYPCNSKTKAPIRDPQTDEVVLGPPVAKFGNKHIIVREDLKTWVQKHAQPLVRSTWSELIKAEGNHDKSKEEDEG